MNERRKSSRDRWGAGRRGSRPPSGGPEIRALHALARSYGVEERHRDGMDREVRPSPETLAAVLRALGAPLGGVGDAPAGLRARKAELAERPLDPVAVVRPGERPFVRRGPALKGGATVDVRLVPETGVPEEGAADVTSDGLRLPFVVPPGHHRLEVRPRDGGPAAGVLLISAPARAYGAPGADPTIDAPGAGREWGVFLPLHALRTSRDVGIGDLTDLEALRAWVRERGGSAVGLLPLLASFEAGLHEPSPYSPVSRLFWNDLHLDPEGVPEWQHSAEARALAETPGYREGVRRARASRLVDRGTIDALRGRLLARLADAWHARDGDGSEAFRAFLERRPDAPRYAAFRAALEARGDGWERWPGEWRRRGIPLAAFDPRNHRRHLYAQFRFEEQLGGLSRRGRAEGTGLYLDLPLGAHARGYDTWAEPGLFAEGAGMGAPPDRFHEDGQDWGLAPVRPEAARADGHAHLRAVLARLLPHARWLRIDHVMCLHRLYWVPAGMSAKEGAYVRQPASELYALFCLESHRHRTMLVGEDLGTVPPEVPRAMDLHGIRRMFVVPFQLEPEAEGGLKPVPEGAVAGLNTHDLPTFAGEWAKPERRRELRSAARVEDGAPVVLRALLERLGRSPAGLVVVNLEDLWLEKEQQNVPGTADPGNWRRRARLTLEEMKEDEGVLSTLAALDGARGEGAGPDGGDTRTE